MNARVTYPHAGAAAADAFIDGADTIAMRLVSEHAEWDGLVALSAAPHLPQSYAYGEAKAASGWDVERAVFTRGGRPLAIATILVLRRLRVRLVHRINRGPVFLDPNPTDQQVIAVYREVRRHWGRLWTAPLLIAPALPLGEHSNELLRKAGYRLRQDQSWCSGRIDLTPGKDELWSGVSSGFRNRLRNAQKAGAELRIAEDAETYEWMLARHVENMSAKGFSAANPTMLRALRNAAPRNVLVFQAVRDGEPVAGMSVVRFGASAEYHIGWFGEHGRKINAGNFLMWNILLEMHKRGARVFDVGGLKPGDGYTRFKQTMNPVEYALAGEWMSF